MLFVDKVFLPDEKWVVGEENKLFAVLWLIHLSISMIALIGRKLMHDM